MGSHKYAVGAGKAVKRCRKERAEEIWKERKREPVRRREKTESQGKMCKFLL